MSDLIDNAQQTVDLELTAAMHAQRVKADATPTLSPVGECLNPLCAEVFSKRDAEKLFCDPNCATQYQRYIHKYQ